MCSNSSNLLYIKLNLNAAFVVFYEWMSSQLTCTVHPDTIWCTPATNFCGGRSHLLACGAFNGLVDKVKASWCGSVCNNIRRPREVFDPVLLPAGFLCFGATKVKLFDFLALPGGCSVSIMVCYRWTWAPLGPCDWCVCVCFHVFFGVVYYGMHAGTAWVLWSVEVGREGGGVVTMTTGLLRGLGLVIGKGEGVLACNVPRACMCSSVGIRAYVRVVERRVGGGGSRLSIMVCPLRGNYAESCECGRGGLLWDVCPLCVLVRMLAKLCLWGWGREEQRVLGHWRLFIFICNIWLLLHPGLHGWAVNDNTNNLLIPAPRQRESTPRPVSFSALQCFNFPL